MNVTFESGGHSIPASIFAPSTAANGGLIILAYGSDGLVDNANGPWKTMIERYAVALAADGFVAAIPDYFARTGTSPGDLNPANPAGYLEQVHAHRVTWQITLEDAASELAKPALLPGIDASRIGFLGFSLGGHLCARATRAVRALVVFFAPRFDGLVLSGTLFLKAEIHHGANDFLNYSTNAVPVAQELTSHGADCHLWPAYPGAVHGFVGYDVANSDARRVSKERTIDFFGRHL